MTPFTLAAGILAGVAIATQSAFNAAVARAIGFWPTTLVVHVVGAVAALVPVWLFRAQAGWAGWTGAPWYVYLGGVLGVAIIYSVSVAITHSGVGAAVSVIIAAQLCAALLVDHFGWFGVTAQPLNLARLVGAALLVLGAWLVVR